MPFLLEPRNQVLALKMEKGLLQFFENDGLCHIGMNILQYLSYLDVKDLILAYRKEMKIHFFKYTFIYIEKLASFRGNCTKHTLNMIYKDSIEIFFGYFMIFRRWFNATMDRYFDKDPNVSLGDISEIPENLLKYLILDWFSLEGKSRFVQFKGTETQYGICFAYHYIYYIFDPKTMKKDETCQSPTICVDKRCIKKYFGYKNYAPANESLSNYFDQFKYKKGRPC